MIVCLGKKIIKASESLDINIHQGLRTALIGKNGAGKSTIMKVISGCKSLDDGEKWVEPGISIGYLGQDFKFKNETFDSFFGRVNTLFIFLPSETSTVDFRLSFKDSHTWTKITRLASEWNISKSSIGLSNKYPICTDSLFSVISISIMGGSNSIYSTAEGLRYVPLIVI